MPLRRLDRYVIREILPPMLLALLIFTFLLTLPPFMDHLENLLAKGVGWSTVARLLWTLVPQALGLTIPMALLVGILIGLGRLSGDRETVALLACGVSPYRLLRPVLVIAVAAAAVTCYVMVVAIPQANRTFLAITFDIISKRVESDVRPRVFFEDFPGWTLYAADEAGPGEAGWRRLLVANTARSDASDVYFAAQGRLAIDRAKRTVDLILDDGMQYKTGPDGNTDTLRFTEEFIVGLNPEAVFPPVTIQKGPNEKTIAELRAGAAEKVAKGMSPHPEVIALQQKFSFPVACIVFAVIGLAVGLSVAREGKLAGFVVGIVIIFAYYVVMFLAESLTKGHYLNAHLSRWVPNILLGAAGVAAMIWRARFTSSRLWLAVPIRFTRAPRDPQTNGRSRSAAVPRETTGNAGADVPRPKPRGVVLVIRVPRGFGRRAPSLGLLDRYISSAYLRIATIAFTALLTLFYISTFLDKSDKIFKGQATASSVLTLLVYMTPQFVYFVIPIAALLSVLVTFGALSRSSELTVMKACGISLYRAALPVIALSLVFSAMIFGLEQRVLARANRRAEVLDAQIRGRPPRIFDAVNRRWVVSRDGDIYHFRLFDPERDELAGLTIYTPRRDTWTLATATYAERARYRGGWEAAKGWVQDFTTDPPRRAAFTDRRLPNLESPEYFESEQPVAEMMTVGQLRRYVQELSASGLNVTTQAVELQRKLAFPFVTLVMTLLAVPFGVSMGRRGTLYGIGIGIVMALSYWILSSVFVAFGKGGLLDPVLAGWAPNVIVLGTAGYLFLTVKT
ncbi:MAG TPA: LPS export ABC transporter permease LptG [Vicinamibacterales bacterium]|nr:LPS export ABC transporter permease LptG [Vicinamibacterales bacterium]